MDRYTALRATTVVALTTGLYAGKHVLDRSLSDYASKPQLPTCLTEAIPESEFQRQMPVPPTTSLPKATYTAAKIKWQKEASDFKKRWIKPAGLDRHLKITFNNGYSTADPGTTDTTKAAVYSIVQVHTDEMTGSGILTLDGDGNEAILTAAHVVSTAKLNRLEITTDKGETTHAVGGCYEYDHMGKHQKLDKDHLPAYETDIAVLYPAQPLSGVALNLRTKPVQRGEWTHFVNYQSFHRPGAPAMYTGVAATNSNSIAGFSVITGAHQFRTPITLGDIVDNRIQPGASGGGVLDDHNQIVGISTSGMVDGHYLNAQGLQDMFNMSFENVEYGAGGGFVPALANVMPASLAQKVLAAATKIHRQSK